MAKHVGKLEITPLLGVLSKRVEDQRSDNEGERRTDLESGCVVEFGAEIEGERLDLLFVADKDKGIGFDRDKVEIFKEGKH